MNVDESERDALANLIPLGFTDRDPYRDVYEAADAILAAGFRRPEPITDAQVEAAARAIHDQECSCQNAGFHGRETIAFREESARAALEAARDAS